ncbi:MAG: flagellar biosynthetic protein FliO [Calditrichaeota bacterium]|nr:flagellar biosynthetic protein FliO [Calditrichota bacterium]
MPVDSLASGWSSGVSFWQFAKVLLLLSVVLALLWGTVALLKRASGGRGSGASGMSILGGLPLGPRRSLLALKVGSRVLIIGVTDHHISRLAEIDDPEAAAAFEASGSTPGGSFANLLERLRSRGGGKGA